MIFNTNACLRVLLILTAMNTFKSPKIIRYMHYQICTDEIDDYDPIAFQLAATKIIIKSIFRPNPYQSVHHVAKMQKNTRNSEKWLSFNCTKCFTFSWNLDGMYDEFAHQSTNGYSKKEVEKTHFRLNDFIDTQNSIFLNLYHHHWLI